MEKLLKKIKEKGHWKIIVRPTSYIENLINSTDRCEELIESSKVSLRGWDYPHIDVSGIRLPSIDSIHSFCDWPEGPMFEYWRFYQTGQFVHYLSLREDLRISPKKIAEFQDEFNTKSEKFLSILGTIYTATEILEFARKLYGGLGNLNGIEIIMELHDSKGRVLTFWDTFMRSLYKSYTCEFEEGVVSIKKVISKNELLNRSDDIALDFAFDIFRAFNWKNPTREVFREDQRKFLEGRL